jgi:hypothetical protein
LFKKTLRGPTESTALILETLKFNQVSGETFPLILTNYPTKVTISTDIGLHFRVYRIKSVLSVELLRVFTIFYFTFLRDFEKFIKLLL